MTLRPLDFSNGRLPPEVSSAAPRVAIDRPSRARCVMEKSSKRLDGPGQEDEEDVG